jgi:hypothetical protein
MLEEKGGIKREKVLRRRKWRGEGKRERKKGKKD